ncbi:hypothetical protein AN641_01760 [Candidatus Epulonipiscioides gigas]|nr:hypothetical protein AN641_01760 [Epulopiscium sp. SCG-C07WGA-EpuloA2]
MKKHIAMMGIGIFVLTGCDKTARDVQNMREMVNGQVVEVEGSQDQYGYFPHLRLTFDENDKIQEVYFDYINSDAEKKSKDEEYNSNMQEKTGTDAEHAMIDLSEQLVNKQNLEDVEIIAGATQTSKEFIEMAAKAIENYKAGNTSHNNYGEGSEIIAAIQRGKGIVEENTSKYVNGGDGNS